MDESTSDFERLNEAARVATEEPLAAWQLVALTKGGLVMVIRGDDESCLDYLPESWVGLTPPAIGGMVVRTTGITTRVVGITLAGEVLVLASEAGAIEVIEMTEDKDLEALLLLWRLADPMMTSPTPHEILLRVLMTRLLSDATMPIGLICEAALMGDLGRLARMAGAGPVQTFPDVDEVMRVANELGAADLLMQAVAGIPEPSALQALHRIVLPRWALAEVVGTLHNRPDLGAMLMSDAEDQPF